MLIINFNTSWESVKPLAEGIFKKYHPQPEIGGHETQEQGGGEGGNGGDHGGH